MGEALPFSPPVADSFPHQGGSTIRVVVAAVLMLAAPAGATVMLLATGDGVALGVPWACAVAEPPDDGAEADEPGPLEDDPWPAAAEPVAPPG